MAQDTLNSLEDGGLFPRLQQRYGMRENPLEMEAPFFPGAGRQHALESLRHLCGFGDMVPVITGASGAGKTRLLAEFVRHEAGRLDIHRIPASALTSGQALARDLKKIARSAIPDDADAKEAVFSYFRWSESRARRGQRQVLLVDDADQGAPEVVQLLLAGFLSADRSVASVPVFAGKESFYPVVAELAEPAYLHRIDLLPLSPDDIEAYLRPRVERAGGPAKQLLAGPRLKKIHALSEGSFGKLKRVTPGIWLDMVRGSTASVASRLPSVASIRSLRWPALALVLLGGSFWFVSQQYNDAMRQTEQPPEPEPVRKSITIGPESTDESSEASGLTASELLPEPAGAVQPPEPEEALSPELGKEQAVPEPEPEPEPEPGFTPENPDIFVPRAEVRQRSGWTLQLVAGQLEQTVLNVYARAPEDSNLRYTVGERQGEPWFMLIYGQYESKEQARAATSSLPSALGIGEPWVRSFDSF